MRSIRSKDTAPELTVRSALHRNGYRFRLHRTDLPGKPDIVLPKHKAAVFVHGCFWHQHPDPDCRNAQLPRTNTGYWTPKLARNVKRDRDAAERLRTMGWRVLTVWECETKSAQNLARLLRQLLG